MCLILSVNYLITFWFDYFNLNCEVFYQYNDTQLSYVSEKKENLNCEV